jgi:hypothetical protein
MRAFPPTPPQCTRSAKGWTLSKPPRMRATRFSNAPLPWNVWKPTSVTTAECHPSFRVKAASFEQVMSVVGERGRNRTYNLLIKSQLLCQLSYAPISV